MRNIRYLYCLSCGEPLSGKKRKFCDDAHRKRYKRMSDNPRMSANSPRINKIVRKSSANVRESSANNIIVAVVVEYDDQGQTHEWDGFALHSQSKKAIQAAVRDILEQQFPHWTFEHIEVTVKKS